MSEVKIIPELNGLKGISLSPNAPFDEVVDTLKDIMEIMDVMEETLSDGWQRTDIFKLLIVQPEIVDIVDSFSLFIKQFLDLNEETAVAAILEVGNTYKGNGKVARWFLNSLYFGGMSFAAMIKINDLARNQITMGKDLFAGVDIFPKEGSIS